MYPVRVVTHIKRLDDRFGQGRRRRPPPRGLGLATATTSATFLPHCEQRIRAASAASVTFLPTRLASASG